MHLTNRAALSNKTIVTSDGTKALHFELIELPTPMTGQPSWRVATAKERLGGIQKMGLDGHNIREPPKPCLAESWEGRPWSTGGQASLSLGSYVREIISVFLSSAH